MASTSLTCCSNRKASDGVAVWERAKLANTSTANNTLLMTGMPMCCPFNHSYTSAGSALAKGDKIKSPALLSKGEAKGAINKHLVAIRK